jgi:small subunit ribosomal protein S13
MTFKNQAYVVCFNIDVKNHVYFSSSSFNSKRQAKKKNKQSWTYNPYYSKNELFKKHKVLAEDGLANGSDSFSFEKSDGLVSTVKSIESSNVLQTNLSNDVINSPYSSEQTNGKARKISKSKTSSAWNSVSYSRTHESEKFIPFFKAIKFSEAKGSAKRPFMGTPSRRLMNSHTVAFVFSKIYGLGNSQSRKLCLRVGLLPSTPWGLLSSKTQERLSNYINKSPHKVNQLLQHELTQNANKELRTKTRRSLRKVAGLPCRGQRTSTNGKTARRLRGSMGFAMDRGVGKRKNN